MTTHSSLTLASIAALLDDLPPTPRLIVGAPFMPPNAICEHAVTYREHTFNVVWMGSEALAKLQGHAVPFSRERDPFAVLSGIELEPYNVSDDEHRYFATVFRLADSPPDAVSPSQPTEDV